MPIESHPTQLLKIPPTSPQQRLPSRGFEEYDRVNKPPQQPQQPLPPLASDAKTTSWGFGNPEGVPESLDNPNVKQLRNEEPLAPSHADKSSLGTLPEGGFLGLNPTAAKDASFYSVKLPSDFRFYGFKDLSVSLVKGRQQAKFNRAANEGVGRYMMEGVTSLLGDGRSALELTSGDFYWLLYWLLFASYPKRSRTVTITCQNDSHLEQVEKGLLEESSLRYLTTYDRPVLNEMYLDWDKVKDVDVSSLAGLELGAFFLKDMLEWEEAHDENANTEDTFIYDLAVYLRTGTLEERAEIVRDLSPLQTAQLTAYKDAVSQHGVSASLKSVCKGCGAENGVNLSVSAHDFL